MSFLRRFFFYFVGVSLGVALSYAFFSDRNYTFNYFPNQRVLSHLRNGSLSFTDTAFLKFKKLDIDTIHITDLLINGKVNFSKSNKSKKHYYVTINMLNKVGVEKLLSGFFELNNDTTLVLDIW